MGISSRKIHTRVLTLIYLSSCSISFTFNYYWFSVKLFQFFINIKKLNFVMIILYIKCVSFHHSLWIVRTATLPDKWVTNTLTNPHSKGRVHFFFWRLFYVVSTTLYRSVSSHVKDLLAIQLYSYIIPCIQGIIHSYNFCPYLVQSQWICVKYWSVKLLWNIFCTCSIIDSLLIPMTTCVKTGM